LDVLTQALSSASKQLDRLTEQNGVQYGTQERLAFACNVLELPDLTEERYREICTQIHKVQVKYRPLLTEPDLATTLRQWRERYGLQLAIICNTGMASGEVLVEVLASYGLMELIDYPLWSDAIGVAKPNRLIFERLSEKSRVAASAILHLGDNPRTDVIGAMSVGMNALHYDARHGMSVTDESYLRHSELHDHPRFKALI
jgi:FMN phosphatase YigB (HAD superfamily)